jgi:RimJ/RimL family protein N-acetyltransferase
MGCSDPETQRWLPPLPIPYTADDARAFLRQQVEDAEQARRLTFAIRLVGASELVGSVGVSFDPCRAGVCQIGYWVVPTARCQGVARRAVRLLATHVFTTWQPGRIELRIDPRNAASARAAEAAGARCEGIRAATIVDRDGSALDALVYTLFPTR